MDSMRLLLSTLFCYLIALLSLIGLAGGRVKPLVTMDMMPRITASSSPSVKDFLPASSEICCLIPSSGPTGL